MGNQLVGIAPQHIHPVEYYLSDLTNTDLLTFDSNLGSTRFFKVARVKLHQNRLQLSSFNQQQQQLLSTSFANQPGLAVAKVFVIHDPSLPLKAHKDKVDYLRDTLKDNPNALPFSKIILNDKAGILLRQYIKYNLYDRLSTRPFLTHFEKKWIIFQLLKCFQWCHQRNVYHGDLKLENILVTSSQWIYVTDFASYKPILLPEDNPADFSFFFDTSRRRTCNIAPERFVSETQSQSEIFPSGGSSSTDSNASPKAVDVVLTPQMDLFSIGCVTAELFSEDAPNNNLFDLSQLLSYRNNSNQISISKVIQSISDDSIRKLVLNLVEFDPSKRNSVTQHLTEMTPSVFPIYFNVLYNYLRELTLLSSDSKIMRLSRDIQSLVPIILKEDAHGLLLLLLIVTSTLRSLKHIHSKIASLRLLCKILDADHDVLPVYVLDRILPYLVALLNDQSSRVRAEAITCLTYSLKSVNEVTPSETNVFTDYILPILCQIVDDRSVLVRMTLASNLTELSQIASRFLTSSSQPQQSYEAELMSLQDTFQFMASHLLTDLDNSVKRTLLSQNISKLCTFFGRQKTNDIMLSHIITFLNDKEDFELRCSFFDFVVPIVCYLGIQCSAILKPLLQQGLTDPEETVIYKTLMSLSTLTQMKLISKNTVFEILSDSISLVSHPNLWIRHALVSLILNLADTENKILSLAEVNCKLMPMLKDHMVRDIHSLSNSALFMDSLKKPVSRGIYNFILNQSISKQQMNKLFESLAERKLTRSLPIKQPSLRTGTEYIGGSSLLEKLLNEGLNEETEDSLLHLSETIKRISRNSKFGNNSQQNGGHICISRKGRRTHIISLGDKMTKQEDRSKTKQPPGNHMNEEWLHMFSSQKDSTDTLLNETNSSIGGDDFIEGETQAIPIAHEAKEITDQSSALIQCPPCFNDVQILISHKKDDYYNLLSWNTSSTPKASTKLISSSFRPRGILIAHLHEHSGRVNRILPIENTSLFVTCSTDATIKVWDSKKMENFKQPINRCKQTFITAGSASVEVIAFLPGFNYLISCTNTNILHILRIDSKVKLIKSVNLSKTRETMSVTDIAPISAYVYAIASADSTISGFDTRSTVNNPAWTLQTAPHEGLLTCIDGTDYALFCATSAGQLIVYDIRFLLRATMMSYPTRHRIRRILFTQQGLFSSVQGNNEVTLWDCESGSRVKTLWASRAPLLSTTEASCHSVQGLISLKTKDTQSLITCGSDMRIRYWDLLSPHRSYIISDFGKAPLQPSLSNPAACTQSPQPNVTYSSKFIEGIQVIQEHYQQQKSSGNQGSPTLSNGSTTLWDQQAVSPAHRDSITDIAWLNHSNLLVSSSRDGVVKLWK